MGEDEGGEVRGLLPVKPGEELLKQNATSLERIILKLFVSAKAFSN